mgnify:CR=1 FL=1
MVHDLVAHEWLHLFRIADDGEVQLPVIYVVADAGTTIDVGVQADVAESTVDWATVRFADDIADTFDPDLDSDQGSAPKE